MLELVLHWSQETSGLIESLISSVAFVRDLLRGLRGQQTRGWSKKYLCNIDEEGRHRFVHIWS